MRRLTPRQLQTTTPRSQWLGVCDPTTPKPRQIVTVSWNVDACTILPQPLTPSTLSGIPEGSIDSIDRGSLRGDPLGLGGGRRRHGPIDRKVRRRSAAASIGRLESIDRGSLRARRPAAAA